MGMIKIDGKIHSYNTMPGAKGEITFGLDSGRGIIKFHPRRLDWEEVKHALGGYPSLVINGKIEIII